MTAKRAFVGLGSNLAEPSAQLAMAVSRLANLPDSHLVAQSPFYRSRPVGPQDQPDFINGAACLETELSPERLLDHLQAIENDQGRERHQKWGPRTLDLDLLLYGEEVVSSTRLTVPHPELPNRDFVLQPLLDLDPELRLPDGRSIAQLRASCPDNSLQRLEPIERQPGLF